MDNQSHVKRMVWGPIALALVMGSYRRHYWSRILDTILKECSQHNYIDSHDGKQNDIIKKNVELTIQVAEALESFQQ